LPDATVIELLTEVHGIGEWTAQMYLIFHLERPDVLPTGDLGLRKAVQKAYRMRSLPAPKTVERIGRRWSPWRSHATFYLWSSLG
jgi:DNA-3-methyladenine glycosylase II